MNNELTTFELIKWVFKETYRPSRLKQFVEDLRGDILDTICDCLSGILGGIARAFVLAIIPLLVVFRVTQSLIWDPITLPIRNREHILKLKAKWEKEL